jgi:peroxiredoxin
MKSVWRMACALALGALAAQAGALELGDSMPEQDTELKNTDGTMLTLGDIAGKKGTLVVFSCNHCPFVKAWQERMVALGNEAHGKDVGVVFVNSNDTAKYPADDLDPMKEQAEKAGYEFPYVMDTTSEVARAFGAGRTPEVFLFDAEGALVYHGAVDDNAYKPGDAKKHYLRDALDALLAGEEIPVKETPSVGCSIKFREKK